MNVPGSKLTFDDMIEHFSSKDVTFNLMNEERAKETLREKNYFFRLRSYRTNFDKDKDGKYKNLDFGMLMDLSIIDYQLRRFVLNIALSIEHNLKTKLLELITEDESEDGYSILQDFITDYNIQNPTQKINMRDIWGHARQEQNTLTYDMYTKYKDNPPIWVVFEIISFTNLVKFAEFYDRTRGQNLERRIKKVIPYLKYVKFLRNAAAHNNPLIRNIRSRDFYYSEEEKHRNDIKNFIKRVPKISINHHKYLKNNTIHHLIATLYVFDVLINEKAKVYTYLEFNDLVKRCRQNKSFYNETHYELSSTYLFLKKIATHLSQKTEIKGSK